MGLLLVLLSGCASAPLPLRARIINKEPYASTEEFVEKFKKLSEGMEEKDFFEQMEVAGDDVNIQRLGREEVQLYVFGTTAIHGSFEDAERFREELSKLHAWQIPFVRIRKHIWMGKGGLSFTTLKSGYDLKITAVFKENLLDSVFLEGYEQVSEERKYYIWDFPEALFQQILN